MYCILNNRLNRMACLLHDSMIRANNRRDYEVA